MKENEGNEHLKNNDFNAKKYIEINSFKLLCKTLSNNSDFDCFVVAAICGCLEGKINIDAENNDYSAWIGKYNIYFNGYGYKFMKIYDFIKSSNVYYNLLVDYFNLWHDGKNFHYDKHHTDEICENFSNLLILLRNDIKTACNEMDLKSETKLKNIYDTLISVFM